MPVFRCICVLMNLFFLCSPYIFHFFCLEHPTSLILSPNLRLYDDVLWVSPALLSNIPISMGLSEMTTSHALSKAILNNLSHCLTFSNWLITIFSQFEFGLFVEFGSNTNHHYSKKHMSLGRLYQKKIWFLKTLNLYMNIRHLHMCTKKALCIYMLGIVKQNIRQFSSKSSLSL